MTAPELPRVIDIDSLLAPHPPRTNFNLFWVDGAYTMRVATVEGAFPWHYHPDADEAWLVMRGHLRIRTELGDVELRTGQATVVRSPLRHSPMALEARTQVLIVNSSSFTTAYTEPGVDDAAARYRELEVDGTS